MKKWEVIANVIVDHECNMQVDSSHNFGHQIIILRLIIWTSVIMPNKAKRIGLNKNKLRKKTGCNSTSGWVTFECKLMRLFFYVCGYQIKLDGKSYWTSATISLVTLQNKNWKREWKNIGDNDTIKVIQLHIYIYIDVQECVSEPKDCIDGWCWMSLS